MNSCRHYPTGRDVGLWQSGRPESERPMRDFVFAQVRRTIKRVIQFTLPLPLAPSNPPHSVRPQLPSRPFRHAAQRDPSPPPPPSERDASGLSVPPHSVGGGRPRPIGTGMRDPLRVRVCICSRPWPLCVC